MKQFLEIFLTLALACTSADAVPQLTLLEAHQSSLRNHPRIKVSELRALAAKEITREVRSAYFPNLSANVAAVGTANENTRLAAAGGLNNPAIFERNAEGVVISQLITDFGRTANLVGAARSRAEAEAENAQATREQILLGVDASFYNALEAQSIAQVARQTIATRQSFLAQVSALASNNLRSDLDVSFAQVNLEESKLLLSRAHNDRDAAFTRLFTLMGEPGLSSDNAYELVEEPLPAPMSNGPNQFVEMALGTRPELLRLRHERDAAKQLARAEKGLRYPTISAIASAGVVPIHDPQLPDAYAAAGVNLSLPLFAGGYYSGRQQEAALKAEASELALKDEENSVIQEVHIAWLNSQNALERLRIARQLFDNARRSSDLAKARYDNGLSSIVEYNQAQLNLISAEITYTNTKYEYLLTRSALDFQTGSLH
jgi:outer membrane protein